MGFWIFMLVMDLLIPVTMVFYWKKISEKASEGDQCDVWIPDGDVHEK